jgi:hypothetical protein
MFGLDSALFHPGTGRFLDYSYAGYNAGESGLPTSLSSSVTLRASNVRSYSDESTSGRNNYNEFATAISNLQSGQVLNIPAGSYVLDRTLEIRKQNIIIRGAGSGRHVQEPLWCHLRFLLGVALMFLASHSLHERSRPCAVD